MRMLWLAAEYANMVVKQFKYLQVANSLFATSPAIGRMMDIFVPINGTVPYAECVSRGSRRGWLVGHNIHIVRCVYVRVGVRARKMEKSRLQEIEIDGMCIYNLTIFAISIDACNTNFIAILYALL